ncbi:Uncharacterised protein [Serratia rubidaea]|nr:Uncharacterised protein [Serratia rubidaea]
MTNVTIVNGRLSYFTVNHHAAFWPRFCVGDRNYSVG